VPQLPAGEALRRICGQQLRAIEQHRGGARAGCDPEELHDLRVAVRRTRSALGEFRKLFPVPQIAHFRGEFRWLGEVTGPVRDLDVYLAKLPDYRKLLPAAEAAALEPFRAFLQRHRRTEQRRLVRRLDSVRCSRLLADWQAFLESGGDASWPAPAARPAGETARRHIWKLYRRFLRQGSAIRAGSPDHDLHRLRITGKKLRYLVEFFRTLYPPAEIDLLVKAMKGIQDFLGDFQDLTVQQARLGELSEQMLAEGEVPPATLQALALLVETLREQQRHARRHFPERFRVFSHGRGRRGFLRLYSPPGSTS
jgi:CHAD domain-containing protein